MKRNFVSVVNRAKGIDDTFPEQMKSIISYIKTIWNLENALDHSLPLI